MKNPFAHNSPFFYTLFASVLLTGCQSLGFGGSPIPVTAAQTIKGSTNNPLPTTKSLSTINPVNLQSDTLNKK
ncbi:hypothetical protein [Psychrobacter sp. DM8]|uniref:hypothetical protein n=1 Tax=unclassified Psychrobacter TaxID=196806 RepID=UPI003F50B773